MKKKFIAALAFTLPMLIACNDNGEAPQPDPDRVAITPTAGIATRAVDATWHKGDEIGIYTVKAGTKTIAENVSNFRYTNSSEDGSSANFNPFDTGNTAYYPQDGSKVDILAYYPYKETSKNDMLIVVDVCDQTNLPAIDLMTAEMVEGKSQEEPEVGLGFTHRLTKVNVALEKGEGAGDVDLTNATVTISGTPGTASYDLFSQSFESFGEKEDIVLTLPTAIVVPTAAGSGVTFTVKAGDKTFHAVLPSNVSLVSGEEVTVKITINQTEMAGITATIKPWTSGPEGNIQAYTDIMNSNDIDLPGTGSVIITTGTISATYLWDGNTLIPESSPIYWKDLDNTIKHNFIFEYTPTVGTPAKDEIKGEAKEIVWGTVISFAEVIHLNSQLTITLLKGTGYTDTEWETTIEDAVLKLHGFSTEAYTLTTNTAVVEPTTLNETHKLMLTAGGNSYSILLKDAFTGGKFEAGKTYPLKATLNRTSLTNISIGEIKDWELGEDGTGEFEY